MRFLCILSIAFFPAMWYNKYSEREVNTMTNFEYIMSTMKDVDLATIITSAYSNTKSPLFEAIDTAFWQWYNVTDNKALNISCQIWLSLPYRPEEWKEKN